MADDKKKGLVRRNPDGTIMKGYTANPGGKVKGIERRMRELVDAQIKDWDGRTLDGWEAMTIFMYKVAMGEPPPGDNTPITMKDRMAAVNFLFDRVHGKAKITVESDTTLHAGQLSKIDVDALSPEELDALDRHVEELAAKATGKIGQGAVLDIAPADVVEGGPDEYPGDPNPDDLDSPEET